jgi:hypothetical protein
MPGEVTEPNLFNTARKEPNPLREIISSNFAVASGAVEVGTTHWYW